MDKKVKVIDPLLTKTRHGGELSQYGYSLEKGTMESMIEFPASRIYYGDVIRLFEVIKAHFNTFKIEIDTNKKVYTFNENDYDRIEDIPWFEAVDALFVAHPDISHPKMFLMLTSFHASISVNDKYNVPFGFFDDVNRIVSKNKRPINILYNIRLRYAVSLAILVYITAYLLNVRDIILDALAAVCIIALVALYAILFYAKRSYYRVYLEEEPIKDGLIKKVKEKYYTPLQNLIQLLIH